MVADLDRVRVFCDGRIVADHARVWARHQSITAREHRRAAEQLRRERIGLVRPTVELQVETRRLADYDDALGLTDNGLIGNELIGNGLIDDQAPGG